MKLSFGLQKDDSHDLYVINGTEVYIEDNVVSIHIGHLFNQIESIAQLCIEDPKNFPYDELCFNIMGDENQEEVTK